MGRREQQTKSGFRVKPHKDQKMKSFTENDIVDNRIYCDTTDLESCPLWWQKQGLSYTASGYGRKIPTRYKLSLNGRKYRVYCCISSNNGTCYIVRKGEWVVVA
jgi:hypothetical protein